MFKGPRVAPGLDNPIPPTPMTKNQISLPIVAKAVHYLPMMYLVAICMLPLNYKMYES